MQNPDFNIKLEDVLFNIPIGICISIYTDRQYLKYISEGFCSLFSSTKEELQEAFSKNPLDGVHPNDIHYASKWFYGSILTKKSSSCTFRIIDKKGILKWITANITIVPKDDFLIIYTSITDVTRMKNIEFDLKMQKAKFKSALTNSTSYIWEYDILTGKNCNTEEVHLDSEVLVFYKNSPEEAIADGCIHPDFIDDYLDIYKKVRYGEKYAEANLKLKTKNGEYIWHKLKLITLFNENGEPSSAIGIGINLSEQMLAEERYEEELSYKQFMSPDLFISYRINLTNNNVEETIVNHDYMFEMKTWTFYTVLLEKTLLQIPNYEERKKVAKDFSIKALLKSYYEGKTTIRTEYRRLLPNGQKRWCSTTMNLIKKPKTNDIIGFIYARDIEREKISMDMMRNTVKTDYDFFIYIDLANDTFLTLTGNSGISDYLPYSINLQESLSSWLFDYQEILEATSIDRIKYSLSKESNYIYYADCHYKNGKSAKKKLHFTWLDKDDLIVMLTQTDVTDIYDNEQKKNKLLNYALQNAEKASRAKTDFLSHMSHEIRTPLNGIKGMLDILADDNNFSGNDYLKKARISTHHLIGLINDILDMSKIEDGKMQLNKSYNDYKDIIAYLEAIIIPLAKERNINFKTTILPTNYRYWFVDDGRLKQILINVLSNAIKYTNIGGYVNLFVSVIENDNDWLEIMFVVDDNGIGMSREFLNQIYSPFMQADKTYSKKGTGLGLAITKKLIELMDGHINIESKENEGTQVTIQLVVKGNKTNKSNLEGSDIKKEFDITYCQGKRVLIVEDDEINREVASVQMNSMGLIIEIAENGKIAVEKFMASPIGYYSMIFMDIMMPVMDGYLATKTIQDLPRSDSLTIPIVAMTANAFASDIAKSKKCGMKYHISKPFDKEQIESILMKEFEK